MIILFTENLAILTVPTFIEKNVWDNLVSKNMHGKQTKNVNKSQTITQIENNPTICRVLAKRFVKRLILISANIINIFI